MKAAAACLVLCVKWVSINMEYCVCSIQHHDVSNSIDRVVCSSVHNI